MIKERHSAHCSLPSNGNTRDYSDYERGVDGIAGEIACIPDVHHIYAGRVVIRQ